MGSRFAKYYKKESRPEVQTIDQRILEQECPLLWRTAGQFL